MRVHTALIVFCLGARAALGQAAGQTADPRLARAQQRAVQGDTAAARSVLDSLLATKSTNSGVRAEAMYWLARFAATPTTRERALTALVVDYPFSPRIGAALFELGTSELSHSDRERAAVHFSRFLVESKEDSNRATASLTLGRLLLDRGERSRACAVLLAGRAELPAIAVEIRNQFDFAAGPCQGVDTSVVISPPPADTASVARPATGEYTVQVAAFDTRSQADRLATRLRGLGLAARVIGTTKPFRVRVGHYLTHAAADAASRKIETLAKSRPFVVLIGPEER